MYILRIILIRSCGILSYSPITYHSFSRLMESYARRRSIKAMPNFLLVFKLCWIIVWRISAYSMVVWCARKPDCVGAWRLSWLAVVVSLALMVAMNTLASGGGMAMLR
jgi:hypothetical protein